MLRRSHSIADQTVHLSFTILCVHLNMYVCNKFTNETSDPVCCVRSRRIQFTFSNIKKIHNLMIRERTYYERCSFYSVQSATEAEGMRCMFARFKIGTVTVNNNNNNKIRNIYLYLSASGSHFGWTWTLLFSL